MAFTTQYAQQAQQQIQKTSYDIGDRVLIEFPDCYKECVITAICNDTVEVSWFRFKIFKISRWTSVHRVKGHIQRPLTKSESNLIDQLAK